MSWLVVLLGMAAVVLWRRRRVGERVDPRRELAAAAMHLGRAVRDGASLPEALGRTATHTRGPVADGLHRAAEAIERGVSVDSALAGWAGSASSGGAVAAAGVSGASGSGRAGGSGRGGGRPRRRAAPAPEEVQLLAAAARFGQASGGDLATAFEGVAVALLDRAEVADESAALCSQARASTVVLCGLPALGVAIFSAVDHRVPAALVGTGAGRLCLVAAVALDGAALWASDRLVSRAVA